MPSAAAASTLQDGAVGAVTLGLDVAAEPFATRENLGSGRLLGGGASACSRSWTKFLATSCSRSSRASVTTGAGGRGVARSSGFFFCASAVDDGGGGLAGLLLLSFSRRAGAGDAAAGTVVLLLTAAPPLPAARGAGGGGGGAPAGRQGKVAYLVAVGGSGSSGGWLDGRRGRDGDEYIGGLAYGSAGEEVHAPLYGGWHVGKRLYAPPAGAAGLAPSPRRPRPRDLFGKSRLRDDRSRRTFSIS